MHCAAAVSVASVLGACGSAPKREPIRAERPPPVAKAPIPPSPPATPAPRPLRGGGYYLDDGPGDAPPPDLESIPEPVPQLEPLHRPAMRPYVVLGQTFTPMTELVPYKARGMATWYGRRYHGKPTSNGEIYDMYAISAAHPTLPIPSYARVTNVANGKSIVVRVNDRGPFLDNRLIDLSYTAAHRLGVLGSGSALVEVETLIPHGSQVALIASVPRPGAATAPSNGPAASKTDAAPGAKPGLPENDPILAIASAARDTAPTIPGRTEPSVGQALPAGATADATGVYLQLGAFGSRENAESFIARIRPQIEWLARLLHLAPRDGLYRVQAGPYATSIEARQAAERIALALGAKPVLVTR